jgi:hypothetical protein
MRNWLILFSYFTGSLLSGAIWLTLTPVPDEAMEYYNISEWELTLYSYSFFVTSVLLSVFSTWLVSKSVFWTMHEIWLTTCIGCWIRVIAGRNFWVSFTGQLVASLGNMPMLVACSSLPIMWFKQSQVVLATSIAAAANFVGMGVSFILMSQIRDIELGLKIQAYFGSVFFLFNLLVMQKDPKVNQEINLKQEVCWALNDSLHMSFILCISSGLGINYSIISIIGLLLEEKGYDDDYIGFVGCTYSIAGLIGGLVAAYLTEIHKSTKVSLIVFYLLTIGASFAFVLCLNVKIADLIFVGIFGAAIIGGLPLGIRACVEYMTNIHDSIPTNMIYMISQVLSCIYTYPIQYFQDLTGISGFWVAAGLLVVSYVPMLILTRHFKGKDFSKESYEKRRLLPSE